MTFLNITNYKTLYGERTTTIAKHLEKLIINKTKIEEHIKFLKICKNKNIMPNGFIIKNKTNCYKNNLILLNAMIKIRNNTLNWKYKQLRLYNIEISTQRTIINIYMESIQPHRDHKNDLQWIIKSEIKTRKKISSTHNKKLNKLIHKDNNQLTTMNNKTNNNKHNDINYIYNNNKHRHYNNKNKDNINQML